MAAKPFHLAWFFNFVADEWNGHVGLRRRAVGRRVLHRDGRAARACVLRLRDPRGQVQVSDVYGGTMEAELKHGVAPKHDPAPLATLLAYCTKRLGIVATLSTSFYPPWLLARLMRHDRPHRRRPLRLEHRHVGRGHAPRRTSAWTSSTSTTCATTWRTSTSTSSTSSGSRGSPTRSCATARRGVYADHTKVRTIDFEGRFYKSRGPLNTVRSPQGQAGARARRARRRRAAAFAAQVRRHDHRVATQPSTAMKEYRDDIRERMEGHRPQARRLQGALPRVTDRRRDQRPRRAQAPAMDRPTRQLHRVQCWPRSRRSPRSTSRSSTSTQPLPPSSPRTASAARSRSFVEAGQRQDVARARPARLHRGAGSSSSARPDQVADTMGEIMEEVGGDGFLITSPVMRLNRRYITEITDGLVPALQRRGLVRTELHIRPVPGQPARVLARRLGTIARSAAAVAIVRVGGRLRRRSSDLPGPRHRRGRRPLREARLHDHR